MEENIKFESDNSKDKLEELRTSDGQKMSRPDINWTKATP